MAKTLNRPQPTSSVASMLQPAIGLALMAKPEPATTPIVPIPTPTMPDEERPRGGEIRPSGPVTGEVPSIARQFTLTPRTNRTLKQLVATYSEAIGLDLKHSELLRAILVAVEHAMPELLREALEIGTLRRPKNDRGREGEREHLERRIARSFLAGMRGSSRLPD
jgi:hypothetical protein